MAQHILLGAASTSSMDSRIDLSSDNLFKWDSIKTFVYLAMTFSTMTNSFSIFYRINFEVPVPIFVLYAIIIGAPYMFMEFFIKQYTGKNNFNESLNPLLKGVNYGIMLQSLIWMEVFACDSAESVIYLLTTISHIPSYLTCKGIKLDPDVICVEAKNITLLCNIIHHGGGPKQALNTISTHHYFSKVSSGSERSTFTQKICIIAVVWIVNFFFCSVSEIVIAKIFKVAYTFRSLSTLIMASHILYADQEDLPNTFADLLHLPHLDFTAYGSAFVQVMLAFGIGLVNVHDFGCMSPTTAVDTCIFVYLGVFTMQGLLRSMIIRSMYRRASTCLSIPINVDLDYYYVFMVLYPLYASFYKAPRFVMLYLFMFQIFSLSPLMAAITYTNSSMLHSEFHLVKKTYISGILSFTGFIASVASLSFDKTTWLGISHGLCNCMIFMATLKIAIVSYLYGIHRFSDDVKFWLGFKPSAYWVVSWSLLPIMLFIITINKVTHLVTYVDNFTGKAKFDITAFIAVIATTLIIVAFVTVKTIGKYVAQAKFFSVFKASNKYGPPDADERRRRRKYDEAITRRYCVHNCTPLDDRFECHHVALGYIEEDFGQLLTAGSELSLTSQSMMQMTASVCSFRKNMSEMFDLNRMH